MAAVASPPPSPPIPNSPGSLSSISSQSASDSSNGSSVPPPPQPISPPLATYTSFDHHKVKFPSSSSRNASPAGSAVSSRNSGRRGQGHRPSQSMSRLGGTTQGTSQGPSGGVSNSPSVRRREQAKSTTDRKGGAGENVNGVKLTRSRTLSFSSAQQAFVPTAPRLTASTSSTSFQAFPSLEEGKVVTSPTSIAFDRPSSTSFPAPSASAPARRPPRRTQTSLSVRSAHTLRVPGPSAGRPGRVDVPTDYLEAKVVFLGGIGVGKTSLINVATYNRMPTARSTIGASFHTKKMTVDDTRVHFQLWDSGGQERFKSMAPLYYRGALAAVLVYDMTDADSLEEIKYWLGELRKNMSSELVILVVGTKSDLLSTYDTVPLEDAQRSVALWLWELDHPDEPLPFGLSSSSSSASKPPPPAQPPPPQQRTSLTRSQTLNTPLSSAAAAYAPFPSITTTPAPLSTIEPPVESISSRMRNLSNKLTYTSISPSSPGAGHTGHSPSASSSSAYPSRPTNGLTTSLTMPDLSGYTLASLNLASPYPHPNAHDTLALTASSAGMARSSSGGATSSSSTSSSTAQFAHSRSSSRHLNIMSLSGLAGRRQSHDERLRLEWEAVERAREEKERVERERREWVEGVVRECKVEVVEVSATANVGIDDIFLSIASQLILRKAEIERQRVLRSRDSIILRDEDAVDTSKAGWCAC